MNTATSRMQTPGQLVLDRYRLLEPVGRGGFATVYRAYDERLGREVAVKVLPAAGELGARAQREARAAAKLSHPNIVTVFELAQEDDTVYLVSELVAGRPLSKYIAEQALSDREFLEVTLQVLAALGHAHARGVVHRDVKPDNLMVSAGPPCEAKIMDFGIARLENTGRITRRGDVVGTLAYMSPEQADGLDVDAATDVYSTALTLYECLTGTNPFRAATAGETLGRTEKGAPPLATFRPDLPRELCRLVDEALEPDPELRLGRADFAVGIEELVAEVSGDGAAATVSRRAGGRRRRSLRALSSQAAGRALGGGLAAAVAYYAASRSGLFPGSWELPLAVATGMTAATLPRLGVLPPAAIALAALLYFSPALGLIATAAAGAYLAVFLRKGKQTALLPVLAPLLGAFGLGLAFPVLAGILARRWRGPATAMAGALALTFYQLLGGSPVLDYVGVANTYEAAVVLAGSFDPVAAANVLAAPFLEAPALALQPLAWLVAALPAAWLFGSRRAVVAGVSLSLAALAGGYLLLPYLLPGTDFQAANLLKTLALCAIILIVLLLVSPRTEPRPSSPHEHTQETRG